MFRVQAISYFVGTNFCANTQKRENSFKVSIENKWHWKGKNLFESKLDIYKKKKKKKNKKKKNSLRYKIKKKKNKKEKKFLKVI